MEFEWDEEKAARNERKHGVSFADAATVFGDPLAITFDDPDHSSEDDRFLTFGLSISQRPLAVVHVTRRDRTRIVSARDLTPRERRIYHDEEA